MKKIFNKWEQLSIKYKLFSITTGLLIALAMIIYLILYCLLPSYYHKYKIDILDKSLKTLQEDSGNYDTETLKMRLYYMSKDQNLVILLRDYTGRVVHGKNEILLSKYRNYILRSGKDEYRVSTFIKTRDSELPYNLDIIMPLQPIDEANSVIRNLMPYIIFVAAIIGIIGAYIYSKVITKPLINIINSEREEEKRRKDFVATISHELKTPITIISGQLEGMIYNVGKYKDRDIYLKKCYDSTQELKDLVNEMIEISKSEILERSLTLTTIEISTLLNKLVKRQLFLIEEKNISTILEIQDNLEIKGDKEKITKAINNIINNGIKYSPQGQSLIIRLYKKNSKSKRTTSNKIYLEVENTGVTIEEQYLSEIFNPFFRIEKSRSRKTGGSGLGLYIVGQILKSHGFEYNIKNKSNCVVFSVIF
ncbi:two-component sensor histidine kinase [Romboutsia maritimum]|uniref:histidine kinase n=1 Tax=Romboutsia maritimum TaxID=2020948 RepID=A0A371ISQ1_9FIRM|nr:HAMP domain-containing sensor histidine kinase [Romboutsia maritimum]RDY23518.1 two-component sensor histidine kinase [Romboutsia maritimum]